jgi:hypothetical protein
MKDQPPIFFNRYQHPFGHTSGASEIILTDPIYRLVAGEETSPWASPPVISPPVVIFRRIGVRAEIRTQNSVLSNTRLAKMVPLSHLHRRITGAGLGVGGWLPRDSSRLVTEDHYHSNHQRHSVVDPQRSWLTV